MILIFFLSAILGSIAGAIADNNYRHNYSKISFRFTKKGFFKYLPIAISIVAVVYFISLFEY